MCDINCIWLFNLLVAAVLFILQQQQYVVASKVETEQHHQQQQLQRDNYNSPYDGISSYAAEAARKYLRRNALPHRVVKRETNNEKSTDFISYMNDFNIQDETSIPEDIIDQQHLQEIIDKQQQGIQEQQEQQQQTQHKLPQKYVGESTAVTSVLNGDDDIIDVNLPFDDSADTDLDADIILESQRSSEQNDDNRTHNSSGRNKSKSNKNVNNEDDMFLGNRNKKNKKNFKRTFNKKEILEKEKTLKINSEDNKVKQEKPKPIKFENSNDYSNQYNPFGDEEDEGLTDSQDDAEGYEDKFELDVDDDDDGSAEYERFKSMREQKQKELQKQKEQMSTQKPMTDEETFNNEYSSEKVVKHMTDYTDDNDNKNKNINDYEIFHKHLLEERKKLLQQQQQQQNRQPQPKQDAIGDIEDNEDTNIFKATVSSNKNIFIPRKIKRHNSAARLDDASNRFTRIKHEEDEEQQQQIKSPINTEENHSDAVAKVSSQEENFKKKYYDILKENSTSAADHHIQQRQHASGEFNLKDLSSYGENDESESTHEVRNQTAFEKEKSLRRSNKRYGHKTHKKKYKDYLRYSQIMTMTTTNSTPFHEHNLTTNALKMAKESQEPSELREDDVADLNGLKNRHAKKLELEKIKTLIPQAPIFVLKTREEKEKSEPLKEMVPQQEQSTTKPFYEGQINYFLETPDDDSERANEVRFVTKGERMDTNDWYRKLSPVLRNGNKKIKMVAEERSGIGVGRSRGGYSPYHHYRPQHQSHLQHGQTRNHNFHQQHQHHHQQQHHRPEHHQQLNKHSRNHAYQRKMLPKRLLESTTPLPPPSRKQAINGLGEIGHQITEIKDLDRYYAKWPHLARVQSKLHEEQMREQQMENYPDYEYDNDDYFEENENKDQNLPPYIRKFNRRNKQLLDLLEGTIAPPTKLSQQLRWSGSKTQPGTRDSSVGSMSVHIDDDYLKEKRKRYHQRQRQIQDLFAQQKTSTTTHAPPSYQFDNAKPNGDDLKAQQFSHTENHLPDEDISISLESTEQENEPASTSDKQEGGNNEGDEVNDDSQSAQDIWEKEIKTKFNGNSQKTNWQMEKLITSTTIATARDGAGGAATKKSAIHKLPSYPSIAGGFMNRPRSRSSQFAPSSGSEFRRAPTSYLNHLNSNNDNMNKNNNNFINAGGFVAYNKAPVASRTINGRFSANLPIDINKQQQSVLNTTTTSPDTGKTQSSSSDNNHLNPPSPSASSSSVTNSFIYHRVVDASPRFVGAGFIAGRKQRLPFVAITDRRLETSKKSLTDHQKELEQNHYPLP